LSLLRALDLGLLQAQCGAHCLMCHRQGHRWARAEWEHRLRRAWPVRVQGGRRPLDRLPPIGGWNTVRLFRKIQVRL